MKSLLAALLLSVATALGAQEISEEKAATEKNPPVLVVGTINFVDLVSSVPWLSTSGGSCTGPSCTLTIAAPNEPANTGLLGPASGGAGAPTFRAHVAADLAPYPSDTYLMQVVGTTNTWVPPLMMPVSRFGYVCGDELFFGSATSGNAEPYGCEFRIGASGAPAAVTNNVGTAQHPGQLSMSASAVADAQALSALTGASSTFLFGAGVAESFCNFQVPVLSTGTQTFIIRGCGWKDSLHTDDGTDGLYIRYTDGTNSGKVQLVATNNSSQTTCDSGFTMDTSFHSYQIVTNSAGTSATLYIDGTSKCSVASNIPTATGRETTPYGLGIHKTVGATQVFVNLDAYAYRVVFATPR